MSSLALIIDKTRPPSQQRCVYLLVDIMIEQRCMCASLFYIVYKMTVQWKCCNNKSQVRVTRKIWDRGITGRPVVRQFHGVSYRLCAQCIIEEYMCWIEVSITDVKHLLIHISANHNQYFTINSLFHRGRFVLNYNIKATLTRVHKYYYELLACTYLC